MVHLPGAWLHPLSLLGFQGYGARSGTGPPASRPLTGQGPGHDMGVVAAGHAASVPFPAPHLGVPTAVLDDFRWGFESPWHMSADLRGRARGPGALDEDAAGMRVVRLGTRPLAAWRPGGVCCGEQTQTLPQCSWGIQPWQGTPCRDQGDGHRAWHATPGRQRRAHRGQTPGWPVLVACVREPLAAFGMLLHRADVFVKNDVVRGGGTDDCREPPQVGRAPIGPARGAAIVAEHKSCETQWGVCAITEGIFTRPGASAHGCIWALGDRDRGAIPCASAARQLPSVPAVRFDPIPSLCGHEGRRHPPAVVVFLPEIPREPGATGARRRDQEEGCGCRWPLTEKVLEVTLAGPKGAQGGDRGAMLLGDRRHGNRCFVDIHADKECARLRQG